MHGGGTGRPSGAGCKSEEKREGEGADGGDGGRVSKEGSEGELKV